ncbi:MAG: S41 family peptidase [Aureispira sp.]
MKLLRAIATIMTISWCLGQATAQENPLWMRYPAISPDGEQIVFSYKGDLYKVATKGGQAKLLTLHNAHDYQPVWSTDGKHIAFASNRYGNFDVYLMSAEGGAPTRLTYHSSDDYPMDFTRDNRSVIFTSLRTDAVTNRMFPSGRLPETYQISREGGRPQQYLTIPTSAAKFNKDGTLLAYHDTKGYEDEFRKHHQSSVTRDIWVYDVEGKNYTQISQFGGEDRNPIFTPNGKGLYYLSEESGTYNVHKVSYKNGKVGEQKQLTRLRNHPVRYLTSASDGLLCFSYDGEIYTYKEGQKPAKVAISILADDRYNDEKIVPIRLAQEMDVSSNGKELLFVNRGEVFVASIESGLTKRITNTPERERTASFSPDGRSILYASERNGSWNLYQSKLAREEEKYFFNATIIEEEVVLADNKETFQPSYSPTGKEVAFLSERTELQVIDLLSKKIRTVLSGKKNYSYSDGDQHYEWSPDGKWFLVSYLKNGQWISEVGLLKADGTEEPINLTRSGYSDGRPRWMMNGEMITWFSRRDGMKNQGSWGGQTDVYGMYLSQDAWDKMRLTKEEFQLLKEAEKDNKKKEKPTKDEKKKEDKATVEKKDSLKTLVFDLEGVFDRKRRLTLHSSALTGAVVSKDGEKLYYLAAFEKGFDLWETNLRTRETKILKKLGARGGGLILSKDGKQLFVANGGKILHIDLKTSKSKPIVLKGEMVLKEAEERAYLFEHAWRQVVKKFYREDLHDVRWDFYKKEYQKFLPHINNGYDFSEMLSELLGELNASHTGCRYYGGRMINGDQTASLGMFYDHSYQGTGLKIAEVMPQHPMLTKNSRIKAGVIIEKIDGQEITATTNYNKFLNRKVDKYTLLALYNPTSKERWEEKVKPISRRQEMNLRYEHWVENCRALTEKLSNGEVGYVHVRGMNNESYKTVYEEVLGLNGEKKAIIVDTRFNGGGWLHDDLATFLNGKVYLQVKPRGQDLAKEPMFKWYKPSAVVMGEGNYSDAHLFPYVYKTLGVGKLIGMPVPGTGTAVWWERLPGGYVFGIPQVGMVTNDGKYMENTQLEPDIKVANDPKSVTNGQDLQIEAAVKELQRQIKEASKK